MIDRRGTPNYYQYLCDMARLDLPRHRNYSRLLRTLYTTPFRWVLPMDENRELDGFELRKEYIREFRGGSLSGCRDYSNVLEVLLAFSRRIEIDVMSEPGNDVIERWFWVMLDNLGLLYYDDENFDPDRVDRILSIWLDRKFSRKGKGNIFLTNKSDRDLRTEEYWWQMQHYMVEKYGN